MLCLSFFLSVCFLIQRETIADDSGLETISTADHELMFATKIQPLLAMYCLNCHSEKEQEGDLDLQRFITVPDIRKDVKPWQSMILQLKTHEMPPKDKAQPTAIQRKMLIDWTQRLINDEARARAGDPGRVPLRRLSNTEYNRTVRDLTGVDLQPTKDFPADGAAGEGFTNAAEALSMSPVLMSKYVDSAKEVAAHAVLLPDGFRFSHSKTKNDWTNESLKELRNFYHQFTQDGKISLKPYLSTLVRNRDELQAEKVTLDAIATKERLNSIYLKTLWQSLTSEKESYPLDFIRERWNSASENDVDGMIAEITTWQSTLWNYVPIGSYRDGHLERQIAKDPMVSESQILRTNFTPSPGQNEVVLHLSSRTLDNTSTEDQLIWDQPRFEGKDIPTLLLRDYDDYRHQFEIDYTDLFSQTKKYLSVAVEATNKNKISVQDLAENHQLNAIWLKRWIDVLAIKPWSKDLSTVAEPGRIVPTLRWNLLNELNPPNPEHPAIKGWKNSGADLPILITNSSDKSENVPGRVSAHSVAVHPTPTEFVAVAWKSPIEGKVQVTATIAHAHPNCGNGVAWWLEKQTSAQSTIFAEGAVDLGKDTTTTLQTLSISKGDFIYLAVNSRDNNHFCDLTEITLTVTELGQDNTRIWDLATDIANNVHEGNPHSDSLGSKDIWNFVQGASKDRTISTSPSDSHSILDRWRKSAGNPSLKNDATELAKQLQALLTGIPPADEKHSDRVLYDTLVSIDGPLLKGIDLDQLIEPKKKSRYGLSKDQFGKHLVAQQIGESDLAVPLNQVIEIRLPAELFRNRQFVVEGKLATDSQGQLVQIQAFISDPKTSNAWDTQSPILATPNGPEHKQLQSGLAEFRKIFPTYICYPHVIPVDEVVTLKTFHREDEPLIRLFLDEVQTLQINNLWKNHRFISKYPLIENEYLPLFIGFVTQDQPQTLVEFFEGQRPAFSKRAKEFENDFEAAASKQMQQLFEFAAQAYRRPLTPKEQLGYQELYDLLREKKNTHENAFRSVLARVLMSPSFLLHLEQAPAGELAGPINDWELASRLSYFLWSSMPDEELRQLAATGQLHQPEILIAQTNRMLKDNRVRALAIEFGTQWIHVRGFDEFREKNENLFPEFNVNLRKAMYEESILFFQDIFQNNISISKILDADYTFLNESLANHYGISGVSGENWRKVNGVKKHGRGGILGFASVQAKQAGSSRTSPVLRGNWVVETLLGEKLPLPPPNVPQLPESETGNGGLTMRQVVEQHVSVKQCAICHQKIDPFGFALEKYDPIGRLRETDLGGLPVDSQVTLQDGTEFEGITGLRDYLLTKKKETFSRQFYQRLLGYALGRSVTLSDQHLIEEILTTADDEHGVSNAILSIVQSKQFRMIRGRTYSENQ